MKKLLALLVLLVTPALAQEGPAYGPRLEGFTYPHPVQIFRFTSQKTAMEMAYMDVRPATANGRTVILLHGKNFCAAAWEGTIAALTGAGYRVIAPDQIGFCKSTKPEHYQYSFEQLAANTRALLLSQLVSVNPLGLEDARAKGVPPGSVDESYKIALNTTAASIKAYQQSVYYAGSWKPEYDKWVEMQAGMFLGPGKEVNAWNSALTSEMIATQPVVHEFERLRMPVLLLIGDKDTTGRSNRAPPGVTLGDFPALSEAAARRIPNAKLVHFADMGHSPQIQDPARFHAALLAGLKTN